MVETCGVHNNSGHIFLDLEMSDCIKAFVQNCGETAEKVWKFKHAHGCDNPDDNTH